MKKEEIEISTSRGNKLSATIFTPSDNIKGAIMLAPATGIKKSFYAAFASYLAKNNFAVITFENEGIGKSLDGAIKACKASLQSWGEVDMVAILEELKIRFPNEKYHLIGHSAGGQLVGLMRNHSDLSTMFNYACSSGRTVNMSFFNYIKASFFMNVFIPINNFTFGYTNTQWIGMGEPLPKNVAREWAEWCNGKGYVKTAFGKTIKEHWYNELEIPSFWVNATDDFIANKKNVADMKVVFPHLQLREKTLNPKELGKNEIGHMKFFSRRNKDLWSLALDWLNEQ